MKVNKKFRKINQMKLISISKITKDINRRKKKTKKVKEKNIEL